MAKYHLGWNRQPHDHRDWHLCFPRHVTATVPQSYNCFTANSDTPPQLDQKNEGACGPHSSSEFICYDQKKQGLPVVIPSRQGIYYATRMLMGTVNQDSGVDNRTMMKALAQYGFAPESLWPYEQSNMTTKPPQAYWDAAAQNRISNYAAVPQQLDQMKAALASGFPFIFGFDVFQQMMSDAVAQTGIVPDPAPGASPIGGHDVLIYAYDDAGFGKIQGGAFKFRNHWMNGPGQPWGDNGDGYISYGYATGQHASDFWAINAIPAPAPTPPSPQPIPAPQPSGLQLADVLAFIKNEMESYAQAAASDGWIFGRHDPIVVNECQRRLLASLQAKFGISIAQQTLKDLGLDRKEDWEVRSYVRRK